MNTENMQLTDMTREIMMGESDRLKAVLDTTTAVYNDVLRFEQVTKALGDFPDATKKEAKMKADAAKAQVDMEARTAKTEADAAKTEADAAAKTAKTEADAAAKTAKTHAAETTKAAKK